VYRPRETTRTQIDAQRFIYPRERCAANIKTRSHIHKAQTQKRVATRQGIWLVGDDAGDSPTGSQRIRQLGHFGEGEFAPHKMRGTLRDNFSE